MTGEIIELVDQEIKLADNEINDFKTLMEAAQAAAKDVRLVISEERLVRLGAHLVAVIRRANSGEVFPPVDENMLQQVAEDMQELARKVLSASLVTRGFQEDCTEVLLLAVHFAAAKESI